ncbi:unnamed protein product [Amoebophrya sp. A25]|nr:unnamed protein product [Amoebophrya sp. A25]|eukprot:GSA25T00025613001.1
MARRRRKSEDQKRLALGSLRALLKKGSDLQKRAIQYVRGLLNAATQESLLQGHLDHQPTVYYHETDGKELRVSRTIDILGDGTMKTTLPDAMHGYPITLQAWQTTKAQSVDEIVADRELVSSALVSLTGQPRQGALSQMHRRVVSSSRGDYGGASSSSSTFSSGGSVSSSGKWYKKFAYHFPIMWTDMKGQGATAGAALRGIVKLIGSALGLLQVPVKFPIIWYTIYDAGGPMRRLNKLWRGLWANNDMVLDLNMDCCQHQLSLSGIEGAEAYLAARGLWNAEGDSKSRHKAFGTLIYTLTTTLKKRSAEMLGEIDEWVTITKPSSSEHLQTLQQRHDELHHFFAFLGIDMFDEEDVEGLGLVWVDQKYYVTGPARLSKTDEELRRMVVRVLARMVRRRIQKPAFNRWFTVESCLQALLAIDCLGLAALFKDVVLPHTSQEGEIWSGERWVNASNWGKCWAAAKLFSLDILLITSMLLPTAARLYAGRPWDALSQHKDAGEDFGLMLENYPMYIRVLLRWSSNAEVHAGYEVVTGAVASHQTGWRRLLKEVGGYPHLLLEHVQSRSNFTTALARFVALPDDDPLLHVCNGNFNAKVRKWLRTTNAAELEGAYEYLRQLLLLWKETVVLTSNRSENAHSITQRNSRAPNPPSCSTLCASFGAETLDRLATPAEKAPRCKALKNVEMMRVQGVYAADQVRKERESRELRGDDHMTEGQLHSTFSRGVKKWKTLASAEDETSRNTAEQYRKLLLDRKIEGGRSNLEKLAEWEEKLRVYMGKEEVVTKLQFRGEANTILEKGPCASFSTCRQIPTVPALPVEPELVVPDLRAESGLIRLGESVSGGIQSGKACELEKQMVKIHRLGHIEFYNCTSIQDIETKIFCVAGSLKGSEPTAWLTCCEVLSTPLDEEVVVEVQLMQPPVNPWKIEASGAAVTKYETVEHIHGTLRFSLRDAVPIAGAVPPPPPRQVRAAEDKPKNQKRHKPFPHAPSSPRFAETHTEDKAGLRRAMMGVNQARRVREDLDWLFGGLGKPNQAEVVDNIADDEDLKKMSDIAFEVLVEQARVRKQKREQRTVVGQQSQAPEASGAANADPSSTLKSANPLRGATDEERAAHQKKLELARLELFEADRDAAMALPLGYGCKLTSWMDGVKVTPPEEREATLRSLKMRLSRKSAPALYGEKGARMTGVCWAQWVEKVLEMKPILKTDYFSNEDSDPKMCDDAEKYACKVLSKHVRPAINEAKKHFDRELKDDLDKRAKAYVQVESYQKVPNHLVFVDFFLTRNVENVEGVDDSSDSD